ncbi:unannotated protein [freshwater metagenome]|uniref:Unannotated protein n=1 Tax=freshwater metagenome TaxID=449393 RepID=A0A6J7V9L6_9ZZZZ
MKLESVVWHVKAALEESTVRTLVTFNPESNLISRVILSLVFAATVHGI